MASGCLARASYFLSSLFKTHQSLSCTAVQFLCLPSFFVQEGIISTWLVVLPFSCEPENISSRHVFLKYHVLSPLAVYLPLKNTDLLWDCLAWIFRLPPNSYCNVSVHQK